MELKDVILSTLAEIEDLAVSSEAHEDNNVNISVVEEHAPEKAVAPVQAEPSVQHHDEIRMLEGIRERLLVLFEGFQSPNNVRIEAKVDLTLNFLEYLLATIDGRLENIKETKNISD